MAKVQPICKPAALRRTQAAIHVGVSVHTFGKLVAAGIMPQPIILDGGKRWITQELENALYEMAAENEEQEVNSCDEIFS